MVEVEPQCSILLIWSSLCAGKTTFPNASRALYHLSSRCLRATWPYILRGCIPNFGCLRYATSIPSIPISITMAGVLGPLLTNANAPILDGILQYITRQDFHNAAQALGPAVTISQDLRGRLWSGPCKELIPFSGNQQCLQHPRARPYVRVRPCQGAYHYPNYDQANPQRNVPEMTTNGTWPDPTEFHHHLHPVGQYVCERCRNRDRGRRHVRYHLPLRTNWVNLCVKHCKAPPNTGRPSIYPSGCCCADFNQTRWSCDLCNQRQYSKMLQPRGLRWRGVLKHTHRKTIRNRHGVKIISTYVDDNRPRIGHACPIINCGLKSAKNRAAGRNTHTMCLCCCGIFLRP